MKKTLLMLCICLATSASGQWTRVDSLSNVSACATSADGQKLISVTSGNTSTWYNPVLWSSTNWGSSWISNNVTALDAPFGIACSADALRLVAIETRYGDFGPDWAGAGTSTNMGVSWSWHTLTNSYWLPFCVACSADGEHIVASGRGDLGFGWPGGVFVSHDFGSTWQQVVSSSAGSPGVTISADGRYLAAAMAGNPNLEDPIMVSTNWGANWETTSAPLRTWASIAGSADGTCLVAVAENGFVACSTNRGATWTQTWLATNLSCVASSADGTRLVTGGAGGLYVSVDAGANWTRGNVPLTNGWISSVVTTADGCMMAAVANPWGWAGQMYTLQTTPKPLLKVSFSVAELKFSWVVPSVPLLLQESADLGSPNWKDLRITPPTLNYTNLHQEVKVPAPTSNRFYRLAQAD